VIDYDRFPVSYLGGEITIIAYISKNGRRYSDEINFTKGINLESNQITSTKYGKYLELKVNIPENSDLTSAKSYNITFSPKN